jgi:hypothetical protein
MTKKVISTRLDPNHIAKARDGLKSKGYEGTQIDTLSSIIRLVFFHGMVSLPGDITQPASEESQIWVRQKINQKQTKTNRNLNDIIK